MEEIYSKITKLLFDNLDITYIVTVNILCYLIIKVISSVKEGIVESTLSKRIILLASIVICSVVYHYVEGVKWIVLFNSSIAAPVLWSWVLKPIAKKFNLDYSDETKLEENETETNQNGQGE